MMKNSSEPCRTHRRAQLDTDANDEWQRIKEGLTAARIRQGLTQAELAARIGTSQSSVSKFESGMHVPHADKLIAHILALGGRFRIDFP